MAHSKKFKKGDRVVYAGDIAIVEKDQYLFRNKPHVDLIGIYGVTGEKRVSVTKITHEKPSDAVEAPVGVNVFDGTTFTNARITGETLRANESASKLEPVLNKYERRIFNKSGESIVIDVYDVLEAYTVNNAATAHAVKKALVPGNRGHKDIFQDLDEVIQSTSRAIQIEFNRLEK